MISDLCMHMHMHTTRTRGVCVSSYPGTRVPKVCIFDFPHYKGPATVQRPKVARQRSLQVPGTDWNSYAYAYECFLIRGYPDMCLCVLRYAYCVVGIQACKSLVSCYIDTGYWLAT